MPSCWWPEGICNLGSAVTCYRFQRLRLVAAPSVTVTGGDKSPHTIALTSQRTPNNHAFSCSYLHCEQVSERDGSRDLCCRGPQTISGNYGLFCRRL